MASNHIGEQDFYEKEQKRFLFMKSLFLFIRKEKERESGKEKLV